jgi:hypothetical protein
VQHFFVDHQSSNPEIDEDVGGLDPDVSHPNSITRFLNLPTVIECSKPNTKDPIVNFAKSVILTLDEYVAATTQLKEARETAIREKKQNRAQKDEVRKRKAAERKEASMARTTAPEESQWLKGLWVVEQAGVRARQLVEREEAQGLKAQRVADLAADKATHASENAKQATKWQQA